MFKDSNCATAPPVTFNPLTRIAADCNGCGTCTKTCAFLSKYQTPNLMAQLHTKKPDTCYSMAFECSLCGLCTATCPQGLDPSAMFLDFRQKAVQTEQNKLEAYKGILNYEKKGCSKRFSFYSLPELCDTIFFPGCTLPGTRPQNTLRAFEYLKTRIDNLGIVLDCCTKPSHDLGRQEFFNSMFAEMENFLLENKITTIVVACPNCHKIFKTHGKQFNVKTIYEIMDEDNTVSKLWSTEAVTVHPLCQDRCRLN
ncbi:MAG: (Fe-S)-binding protein [Desulfobacteraceae bacterium]|nr:(Fe-S)-binding protein [Desulfobacteraceae bacterium]